VILVWTDARKAKKRHGLMRKFLDIGDIVIVMRPREDNWSLIKASSVAQLWDEVKCKSWT
jgi:hypothetical protein